MIRPQFVKNEIYHIYNRGVEKRDVFLEKSGYLRFIHDLFEFNDEKPASPSNIRFSSRFPSKINEQCLEVQPLNIERKPRDFLVEILAFSLMPNHFHLLLKERKEGGITRFMQKIGTGYTMSFNKKYERVGSLFQGRFKAILVDREEYLQYLLYYIHFNCLDLIAPGWRKGEITDCHKLLEFLNKYRWSSHLDYSGQKNFSSITQREFLLKTIGGEDSYLKTVESWLKDMPEKVDIKEFGKITLEI
ncbi:transposase [Patescibacteria group bacterium]|nr:transposase [Patescibacteria group bacterium]